MSDARSELSGEPSELSAEGPEADELPDELVELVAAERARRGPDEVAVARIRSGATARWADARFFAWSWRSRGAWLGLGAAVGLVIGIGLGLGIGRVGPSTETFDVGARDLSGNPPVRGAHTSPEAPPVAGPSQPSLDGVLAVDVRSSAAPASDTAVESAPRRDTPDTGTSAPHASEGALVSERVMLDRARALVREGRADEALDLLALHARRHRAGALLEEAAALEVRAHLARGDHAAAERALEDLVAEHPDTLHRVALRRAIDATRSSALEEASESP